MPDHSVTGRPPGRGLGPWWAVPLVILGVALGITAGVWQLHRAAEKRDILARFATAGAADALQRLVSGDDAGELRYRMVNATGRYDTAHQVLLDNMSDAGRPGYQVLTPLQTPDGAVLVNRGWVPANGDRQVLPDTGVGGGIRQVLGRIDRLPRPGIALTTPAPPPQAPWPRRLLFPTTAEISAQLGIPLRDYQLLLDPVAPDGYVRDWHPGGMTPDRHLAYAVQWFGLALTVVVIYVVLVLRNRKQTS
ncbi:MAG: SURF1 family protein [Gammaproteobacteria bacterium]